MVQQVKSATAADSRALRGALLRIVSAYLLDVGVQATDASLKATRRSHCTLETGSFKFDRRFENPSISAEAWPFSAPPALCGHGDFGAEQHRHGTVTAQVPHPLLFNQMRTVTGEVQNITRFEAGEHFQVAWTVPSAYKLEFTVFGGPPLFITADLRHRARAGSRQGTYPFDTFPVRGRGADTFRGNIIGYNAGVDLTGVLKNVGAAMLIRYSSGNKQFTPPGGAPFKVEAGGLHAW